MIKFIYVTKLIVVFVTVTYRVVQLGESVEELQTTTIAHNHSGGVQSPPQPVQTIYTNPINGGSFIALNERIYKSGGNTYSISLLQEKKN